MFSFIKTIRTLKEENKRLKQELIEEKKINYDLSESASKVILGLEERTHCIEKEMVRLNYDKRDLEKNIEELEKQLSTAIMVSLRWGQEFADVVFNKEKYKKEDLRKVLDMYIKMASMHRSSISDEELTERIRNILNNNNI